MQDWNTTDQIAVNKVSDVELHNIPVLKIMDAGYCLYNLSLHVCPVSTSL